MATTFAAHHRHHAASGFEAGAKKQTKRSSFAVFVSDLLEDISQKPLQAAEFAKHDMFREHINLMSMSYFALIVLLLAASVPVMAWAIPFLVAY